MTVNEETKEPEITIEDVLGDFGFRIKWSVLHHWADLEVYEIISREDGSNTPFFMKLDGKQFPGDEIEGIEGAEKYLEGFIKWDGCSEFSTNHYHWCGPSGYKKHIALLRHIYSRAYELMGRAPWIEWDEVKK